MTPKQGDKAPEMKTYKDIYEFPLRKSKYGSWVYDAKGNFVFQFEPKWESGNYAKGWLELEQNIIDILNAIQEPKIKYHAIHSKGEIISGDKVLITIRGWGNLTGIGAHNLPAEEAANIQDTFAEFIVERLNSFKP